MPKSPPWHRGLAKCTLIVPSSDNFKIVACSKSPDVDTVRDSDVLRLTLAHEHDKNR